MYFKIYSKSQLILLRKVNKLFGKYTLPSEVIKKIEHIVYDKALGSSGYVIVLLKPLHNDVVEILDILDCYPKTVILTDTLTRIEIKDKKSWMVKGKQWYMDKLIVKGEKSYIWVFYSMKIHDIYGR